MSSHRSGGECVRRAAAAVELGRVGRTVDGELVKVQPEVAHG